MLQIDQLAAKRNGERVHDPISLPQIKHGLVEITGENGAGKTTFLRTLAALHTQYEGTFEASSVLYQGHRIGLDESLTPIQNLAWSAALADRQLDEDDVVQALSRVGMLRYAMTPVARLSQGQQRRIGMARWYLDPADVWLLDEPLTALDQSGQALIADLFRERVAMGKLIVYSTHSELDLQDKVEIGIRATSTEPDPIAASAAR